MWVRDADQRTCVGLIRRSTPTSVELFVSAQYRDRLTGQIGLAVRFSPSGHVGGFSALLERFGGLPNLVYEPVVSFNITGDRASIHIGDIRYLMDGVEVVYEHDENDGTDEADLADAVDFAMLDGRIAVEIYTTTRQVWLLCDTGPPRPHRPGNPPPTTPSKPRTGQHN